MSQEACVGLNTLRGEELKRRLEMDPEYRPWDVYPRPRMVREAWINLNGLWDFGAGAEDAPTYDRSILVPFPAESPLSGVRGFDNAGTPFLFYRKRFVLGELPRGKRLLLHCGGADQTIKALRFNGIPLVRNYCPLLEGPLSLELRGPVSGENTLELTVADFGGTDLPWGKQRKSRGGMWYTPVSGIWQTVWLEWVPDSYVTALRCVPTLEEVRIEVLAQGPETEGRILFEGKQWPLTGGAAVLRPRERRLWTPEDPHLYPFTLIWGEDRVESYFALRTMGTGTVEGIPRLLLNGKPYFFNGLLDQGYWPEGLWTPPDPACFADDILAAKRLGYNTLRKHIKVEPERFYYECDRLGMAVFQDLVNLGPYSFLRDTALPTVGFQRAPHIFRLRSRRRMELLLRHMRAVVSQLSGHPSVVYWTIYNEGWGQQYTTRAYEALRALDPGRVIDAASGWFRVGKSDVDSRHVYFRPFRLPRIQDKPVVLSEFGGYVCKIEGHSFNPEKTYGYKLLETREAWREAIKSLYDREIWPNVERGLCAAVYTQISDVEDEANGMLTYDRVEK